jgi:polysaccharide export outer membrane protein
VLCLKGMFRRLFVILTVSFQVFSQSSDKWTSLSTEVRDQYAYVLGPNDQIVIRALNGEELSDKVVRIEPSGDVTLPLLGRIRAAGFTVQQFEQQVVDRLKANIRFPQVSVSITEFRSQPVSIIGAVNTPGVQQLQGPRSLVEALSMAGGLRPDAGPSIKITREIQWGLIPVPRAVLDESKEFSVAEVSVKEILNASNPKQNLTLRPNDVVSVPRAKMIYVVGEVGKAGGFAVDGQESITVLKAIALAQGLGRDASPRNTLILRSNENSKARQEVAVALNKILTGKSPDVPLQTEDILFIPGNAPKKAGIRALEAAIQAGTGIAIYRH